MDYIIPISGEVYENENGTLLRIIVHAEDGAGVTHIIYETVGESSKKVFARLASDWTRYISTGQLQKVEFSRVKKVLDKSAGLNSG